jgi:dienelactone hydrolase
MAEVLMFHHLHGLTPGVRSFAETLEQAGHTVHAPDLYEGWVFETFDEGAAYAEQVGFDTIIERGRVAAEKLPRELVYAGFSLGVLPAQMLAQTRAGAKGAVVPLLCPGLRVRRHVARRSPGPDPRHGCRPVVRR